MSGIAPATPYEPTDRRVRRTRRRLKEALLELIGERGYDTVTVEEIADRADVGRSTFYSHFDSKEDLLFSGFDVWLLSLPNAPAADNAPEGQGFAFSRLLLVHMLGQSSFAKVLLLESNGRLRRRTDELIAEVVRRELEHSPRPSGQSRVRRKGFPDATQERAARAHAVAGAFLGLAAWWLTSGSELTPEAVDGIFQRTVAGP